MEHADGRFIYPIQPDISRNTHNYQEKIIIWNPLTQNQAVLFQFEVLADRRSDFCILPDGCIELLFQCNATSPQMLLFGKRTKSRNLKLEPGNTYFGFRPFYEAGFESHGLDHLDIMDQVIELHGIAEYEALLLALINAKSFKQRCNIFTQAGLESFWNHTYRYDYMIACSRKICLSHGMIDIGSLGHDIGYTDRHIRQSYKDVFGISPVFYKQIIRFQNSVHLLSSASAYIQGDLTQLSHASGYCDQSYMISTYKKFTQMTPKKLQELIFH